MIEIEARARISDFEKVQQNLKELGAECVEKKEQVDKVFGHPKFLDEDTKIVEGGLSARVRQENDDVRLDFKEIRRESGSGMEINSELDSLEEGVKFLDKLGFEEAFTVTKEREIFFHNGYVISLDQVEELGDFIEVEKEVETKENKDEILKGCKDLLKDLAPNSQLIDKKYGDLMQEKIDGEGDE